MQIKLRVNRPDFQVCLLLIVATLFVYWQMNSQDFINFDDPAYVTDNPQVQGGLTSEGAVWAFTDITQAGYSWIPLTWLSLMLDHDLYGLKAGGYKITNLLLHIANILLLFMILKGMTGELWRSAFVAALFALHPLHVESVAWVTERKDVLSTLFFMLSLWFYLQYVNRPGIKRYFLVLCAMALGLMAKPMLVTLPLVLLLLDYWPLNRFRQSGGGDGASATPSLNKLAKPGASVLELVIEKIPLFLLSFVASIGTFLVYSRQSVIEPYELLSLQSRLANSLVSYVTYIGKTIWPRSLGVLYPHPGNSLPMWHAVGAGLLLVVITLTVLRVHRRQPYLLVGWFWYLGTLLPVIGLVQVGSHALADRFAYVTTIGLYIMIAWGVPELLSGWRHRRVVLSLLAITTILVAMLLSWLQVQYWENSRTLYEHTLRVTKNNWLIQFSLGLALKSEGRTDEAVIHYREALKIRPDYVEAHNDLGIVLAERGDTEESLRHFSEAIRLKPDYADAFNNFAVVQLSKGNSQDAFNYFTEALRLKPDFEKARIGQRMSAQMSGRSGEAGSYSPEGHMNYMLR